MKISLARWCHKYFGPEWDLETHCQVAKEVGADGIELVPPEQWDTLAKHGLSCPLALVYYGEKGPDPFAIGWNNPAHHEAVGSVTKQLIKAAGESGGLCKNVIAFSGMKFGALSYEMSQRNCCQGLFSTGVIKAAEDAGINLSFEVLNDKINLPMCGHPGYDANSLRYALDLINGVQSERLGLLYDVYHFQILRGNICDSLRTTASFINHIHVAGLGGAVPRSEMNVAPQELDWRGIGQVIRETFPDNVWVGIEYIPTKGRDYVADLKAAVALLRGTAA